LFGRGGWNVGSWQGEGLVDGWRFSFLEEVELVLLPKEKRAMLCGIEIEGVVSPGLISLEGMMAAAAVAEPMVGGGYGGVLYMDVGEGRSVGGEYVHLSLVTRVLCRSLQVRCIVYVIYNGISTVLVVYDHLFQAS